MTKIYEGLVLYKDSRPRGAGQRATHFCISLQLHGLEYSFFYKKGRHSLLDCEEEKLLIKRKCFLLAEEITLLGIEKKLPAFPRFRKNTSPWGREVLFYRKSDTLFSGEGEIFTSPLKGKRLSVLPLEEGNHFPWRSNCSAGQRNCSPRERGHLPMERW